jgi:hypothetical protein
MDFLSNRRGMSDITLLMHVCVDALSSLHTGLSADRNET